MGLVARTGNIWTAKIWWNFYYKLQWSISEIAIVIYSDLIKKSLLYQNEIGNNYINWAIIFICNVV